MSSSLAIQGRKSNGICYCDQIGDVSSYYRPCSACVIFLFPRGYQINRAINSDMRKYTAFICRRGWGKCIMSMGKTRKRQLGREDGGVSTGQGRDSKRAQVPSGLGGYSVKKLALLFILLALINYAFITLWYGVYMDGTAAVYEVTGGVEVRTLSSPRSKFARHCEERGSPIVLRNSVVKLWKALNWNPRYLQSKLKTISGVYQNTNRWFGPYFDKQKPLTNFSIRANPYRTNLKMSGSEFFKRVQNPVEGNHLYFTGDLDHLGDWALSDIQPVKELLVLNPKRSSINAWIGQPHVIAHCHYDGYHNFYAQLYGTKKFTMFKPSNWPGLYPYPFLHPSHAQAQVNISNASEISRFPLVRKVQAVEVILEPGDLLYIPPLWFHHVESMNVSISVNVWTDSQQTEVMETVFALPLPVNEIKWTDAHVRAVGTSILVYYMLKHVCQYQHCVTASSDRFLDNNELKMADNAFYFVYRLWTTRYRNLMEKGQLPAYYHDKTGILCESDSVDEHRLLTKRALSALEGVDLRGFTEEVAKLVRGLPRSTWDLWVGNYVEYLAASAVKVEHVALFLQHFHSCVRFVL